MSEMKHDPAIHECDNEQIGRNGGMCAYVDAYLKIRVELAAAKAEIAACHDTLTENGIPTDDHGEDDALSLGARIDCLLRYYEATEEEADEQTETTLELRSKLLEAESEARLLRERILARVRGNAKHIKENAESLKEFPWKDAQDEARCRELCGLYLEELARDIEAEAAND